jgi:hypothetical protein
MGEAVHHLPGFRRVAGVLLSVSLAACSGGGGGAGEASRRTDISTSTMAFRAASPAAATPAPQVVTATFGADVANVAVIHTGTAIANVTSVLNGRTAQITIEPRAPAQAGAGALTGTVAITGYFCADANCTRVEAGNSQTVNVSYQISPVVNFVAPYVGVAGVSTTATLRGAGFLGFAIRGVTFGTTAATATTVVSDTELLTTFPALAAGTYPVQLDIPTHEGAVPSTATMVVVAPPAYAAQALTYPTAITAVRSLVYDAERAALLVGTDAGDGTILRYPYTAGTWGAPASVAVGQLQDTTLSINGAQLLAATRTGITPVDPTALTLGTAVAAPAPTADSFVKNVAITNTNTAIVTTGVARSESTKVYAYNVDPATFVESGTLLNNATPGAPRNGGIVMLITGDPSLTTAPSMFAYSATTNAIGATTIALNQNSIAPVLDRDGTRLALNGLNVYGGDFAFLGTLPATTLAVAFKPDGTRAYTYDSAAGTVLTFDTSVTRSGAALPQVGAAVPLAANPGAGVKMTISPDGGTLFFAGATQIVIQPTP